MRTHGRPLRFIAAVLGGWTAMRVVVLWPATQPLPPPQVRLHSSKPFSAANEPASSAPDVMTPLQPRLAVGATARRVFGDAGGPPLPVTASDPAPPPVAARSAQRDEPVSVPTPTDVPASAPQRTAERSPARLHGDVYLVARGGPDTSLAFGQLGASQAGARLTYAIDGARRLALSARFSAPLHGAGREAAAGLDWRPTRLPVHLLVEDRYDLDAQRHEPAAEVIAGVYRRVPLGLTLDAYAQGGAVAQRGPFADGAARLFRPVAVAAGVRLELGAGGWGGAQRGVARLDLGPSAALTVSHGSAGVRLGADYRIHLAGRAGPGSGPALTLGASF